MKHAVHMRSVHCLHFLHTFYTFYTFYTCQILRFLSFSSTAEYIFVSWIKIFTFFIRYIPFSITNATKRSIDELKRNLCFFCPDSKLLNATWIAPFDAYICATSASNVNAESYLFELDLNALSSYIRVHIKRVSISII